MGTSSTFSVGVMIRDTLSYPPAFGDRHGALGSLHNQAVPQRLECRKHDGASLYKSSSASSVTETSRTILLADPSLGRAIPTLRTNGSDHPPQYSWNSPRS